MKFISINHPKAKKCLKQNSSWQFYMIEAKYINFKEHVIYMNLPGWAAV